MSDNEETPKDTPSTSEDNTKQAKDQNAVGEEDAAPSASTGAVEVAEEKASDDYIRLRVITSDMTNEVHFRVKSATSLGRLKRSYCSKMGFQVEELRFVFDGHRITDDDTPKSLGMINDDVIEIYQERTGGVYQ